MGTNRLDKEKRRNARNATNEHNEEIGMCHP